MNPKICTVVGPNRELLASWRRILSVTLIALTVLIFSIPASAQRTTGTLRGQVLDPSGAVVPDAKVAITNQQTNVWVNVTTTSAGTYEAPSLIPGLYRVVIEAAGFKGLTLKDVNVLSNQENVADAHLDLGVATETIEVSSGAVEVQTTSSSLNNNFNSRDVTDLPNAAGAANGSPLNLAVLAPNVIAQPGGTTGIGGSVGGTRPRDNNFTVDGVDDNNLGVTGNNSTVIPDAVSEFALTTNQFSAEYGHSAGGQFSLVTKTGTNNYHGSGEWSSQNRNFNSLDNLTKNAIASGTILGKPNFDNNRFGGTFGGPIVKDKLFFFGAYEYTTLHGQGTPTPIIAPTSAGLAALQGMAADSAVAGIFANFPLAPAGNLDPITVNGQSIPIGDLVIISPVSQKEHDAQVNADYTLGRHQFGARFLYNQAVFILPVNDTQAQFNQLQPLHNRKIALTDVWTINSRLVNDLRLQYSYYLLAGLNPCTTCPADVTIADLGFNTIGPGDNQTQKQSTYQLADTVSWTHGKHNFKFGGQYNHFIYPQFFLPRSNGDYWYSSTEELVNDLLPSVPGRTLRNAGTGSFLGTQSAFYVFAQDDFKVTPRLTLNLGARYEYWTNPLGDSSQTLNDISNVPGVIAFGNPKTDKNNIAPRIGFAYDPTGHGRTAIRGGFAIAYDVKFQNFASITLPPQLQSELDPASACTLTPTPAWCARPNGAGFLASGGLPQTYIPPANQADARALTTSFIDDTVMPKILTWSLGVQQELYKNATIEVRYLGTRGISLPVQFRLNRMSAFDAGITPVPEYFSAAQVPATVAADAPTVTPFDNFNSNTFAQYGFLANVTSDPPFGGSIYHAGSVNFTQHSRRGLTFNANYTYAHTIDNSTNEFFTSLLNPRRAQDTTRLNEDRSSSDLDVRHKVAISWVYQIPNIPSENRFVKTFVNGFQLGSVFLAQTGQPITIQSGSDTYRNGDSAGDRALFNPAGTNPIGGSGITLVCAPVGGGNTYSADTCNGTDNTVGYLALDPTARYVVAGRGVRANLGRNSLNTPGFGVLNLSVGKNFHFTEGKYLQVKGDFFNVLNHANYSLSNGNIFSVAGITTATTTQGFALPNDPNFLHPSAFFSGRIRSITLGLKFVF